MTQASRFSPTGHGTYPWYPSQGEQPSGYYHQSTSLQNGRLGILIDPGAWTNLAGSNVAHQMATAAINSGHEPAQSRLDRPLKIQGVGSGVQSCNWQVTLPIAVMDPGTGKSGVHYFEAPTVNGTGADLPPLLGLRSMSAKNAVLEMTPGKERLTFPGPGGYTINWESGAMHCKLEKAPSGHLIMPCGEFASLDKQAGGLPRPSTTFHATPVVRSRGRSEPGSSSTRDTSRIGAGASRCVPPAGAPADSSRANTH